MNRGARLNPSQPPPPTHTHTTTTTTPVRPPLNPPLCILPYSMAKESRKGKRKVQGVPQSQTAALPRPQEEEETDKSKQEQIERTKSTKISSLFPKRGNRNTKRTEKYKNKMTHGKTYNKSPRRINHKATKNKTNTGTTALERSVE